MSIEDQENRQGKGVFPFNDMSRGAKHNFSGQSIPQSRFNGDRYYPEDYQDLKVDNYHELTGRDCKHCNGQTILNPDGMPQFMHEEDCHFKTTEYGSEGEIDEFEESVDRESDAEVEDLKRRLEGVEARNRKRLRPNVSPEWLAKLREILRRLDNGQAPQAPDSTRRKPSK